MIETEDRRAFKDRQGYMLKYECNNCGHVCYIVLDKGKPAWMVSNCTVCGCDALNKTMKVT